MKHITLLYVRQDKVYFEHTIEGNYTYLRYKSSDHQNSSWDVSGYYLKVLRFLFI